MKPQEFSSGQSKLLVFRGICIGIALGLAAALAAPADADITPGIPGNVFELDRNATDEGGNTKDDWANVLVPSPTVNGTIVARTLCANGHCDSNWPGVLADPKGVSLFVQGSKDILDITGWSCRDQSAPDKDELTNAYAVAYSVPNGTGGKDLIAFFGADRFDNAGTATMGFWLLQAAIAQPACIPAGDGRFRDALGSPAVHATGDLLVVADFSNGGAIGTVRVFQWVGSGGSAGALDLLFEALPGTNAAVDCASNAVGDICGTINQEPTPSPWTYVPKGANVDSDFIRFGFMEIGVNLSRVFAGSTVPCFSTFVAETRSSAEPNAAQKDFVMGSFNVCRIGVSKECGRTTPDLTVDPVQFHYDLGGCLDNTGFGSVTNFNIVDDPAFDASTLKFYRPTTTITNTQCANLAALEGASKTEIFSTDTIQPGERIIWLASFTSTSNGPSDTVTATAEGSGGAPIAPATASDTCNPAVFNPAISVTKGCTARLEDTGTELVVKVDISGTVCNTGDVPLKNVTVRDSTTGGAPGADMPDPILSIATLPTGTSNCSSYNVTYTPSAIPVSPLGVPQRFVFKDDVTATGALPGGIGGTVLPATAHAECALCPGPAELCPQ